MWVKGVREGGRGLGYAARGVKRPHLFQGSAEHRGVSVKGARGRATRVSTLALLDL
jgi:hypothetical protein